ncbi:ribbon-helix-helix domain-containing protein [Thalassomonas haliotis]|uniref:Ribbon-helix-helix protein CopG domain-containing protein n=1 Tax=Thalassomonas haliotis TaxID=485448 RepID=A0ABY7VKK8_9GAMM|nr:ribbon-helix-helix domain-containing protein [Thalassomonas haliotis]WDE13719.1 hypothetical protein H3N35_09945 [Thalassomonas haliotis]
MSGNLTIQLNPDLNHQLEKLARAKHSPVAFLVEEAINNFVKINLNQLQEQSRAGEQDKCSDVDFFLGAHI